MRGHAFMQNVRRGHYELGVEAAQAVPSRPRLPNSPKPSERDTTRSREPSSDSTQQSPDDRVCTMEILGGTRRAVRGVGARHRDSRGDARETRRLNSGSGGRRARLDVPGRTTRWCVAARNHGLALEPHRRDGRKRKSHRGRGGLEPDRNLSNAQGSVALSPVCCRARGGLVCMVWLRCGRGRSARTVAATPSSSCRGPRLVNVTAVVVLVLILPP